LRRWACFIVVGGDEGGHVADLARSSGERFGV
jgi:hypothetical protein